jgi:hypothetical protein
MSRRSVKTFLLIFFSALLVGTAMGADSSYRLGLIRLKYSGGGDWYNDPSSIPNLLRYMETQVQLKTAKAEYRASLLDEALFSHPVLFLTGHGRISFSQKEVKRLRTYLINGGFLFADDDYGMDRYFREEMKKVFPDKELLEIPFDHPVYHLVFDFPNGLPKTHEHDGGPPKGYGYFHQGRMVVFYAFNTNISDGWADPAVHGDPEEVREKALQMGTNIVIYALTH